MKQPSIYEAQAFHADFERGKASGELQISGDSVLFSGGGRQVTLPLEGLTVKMGGASDRLVFLSHPAQPDWSVFTADRRILSDAGLGQQKALTGQLRQARNKRRLGWGLMAAVLGLILALPLILLFQMDWLTRHAARQVPASWEEKLGKSVLAQYRISANLMPQAEADRLLKPLTAPLLQAAGKSPYPYHFYVVNDPAINAFALPGGHIVIHSGLILAAGRADEVQGVLAHEMSHIREQHGIRSVMGGAGIFLVVQTLLGDASGLVAVFASAAPLLLNLNYSRSFETEADAEGLALLRRAAINPEGLLRFFEHIRAEEKKQLAKIEDKQARDLVENGFGLLNSHPATTQRMERLQKAIAKQPAQQWLNLDPAFSELKAATRAFATTYQKQGDAHAGEH